MGDFNSEMCEEPMNNFCSLYNLKNLIKSPTCFKNPDNPTYIDLILINKHRSFQNTSVIETGLSDFHRLTITVMRVNFQKQIPKVLNYRNYKLFNNELFRNDLLMEFSVLGFQNVSCKDFESIFLHVLNIHAPQKKKYIRADNAPFMTKDLCKAIMVRSRLRNKYLKTKTIESRNMYKKQRNYCVTLLREAKNNYYENLNIKVITDNKRFWKHIKPFFTDKNPSNNNIILNEDSEIVSDSGKCAEIMNNFFSNAAINLDIDRELHTVVTNAGDPVTTAIDKYKNHPSIEKISQENFPNSNFAFQHISEGTFPENLKNANIIPTFKQDDRLSKNNYRSISILPTLSKIYEKILYMQIYEYFNSIFSKYLCGFRKCHSTQHCLLYMLEHLKRSLDKGLKTGILLTDLSKAFDSISHDLLLAKLNAYGFSKDSLRLINDYLTGRSQRTKIGNSFSSWRDILYGVPQGSILGPLLFNIYINDLFIFSNAFKIANYADDCSPFEFSGSTNDVIRKLEDDSHILIQWYRNNYLKPNPDKWHLLLSDVDNDLNILISDKYIPNSSSQKILCVTFDNKLNFSTRITKLCKKAGQKIHALARISKFMSEGKRKLIMSAFISSHFSYCPLIWMCHNRSLNTKINKIHERALRIVYDDTTSSFEFLLQKSKSVKIHHRNLQILVTEIYKTLNNLSPSLMSEIFIIRDTGYNLRGGNKLNSNIAKTVNFGTESISNLAAKIWEQVPDVTKGSSSFRIFKHKIKLWIPQNCPC